VQKPTAPQHLQSASNTAPSSTHPLLNPSADARPVQNSLHQLNYKPVIENNKQIANQQDQKGLQNASTQNRLHRMKIRCKRLSFGPEPK